MLQKLEPAMLSSKIYTRKLLLKKVMYTELLVLVRRQEVRKSRLALNDTKYTMRHKDLCLGCSHNKKD